MKNGQTFYHLFFLQTGHPEYQLKNTPWFNIITLKLAPNP